MKIIYTPEAKNNLHDITRYISRENESLDFAKSFVRKIISKCEDIASYNFQIGTLRPELGKNIRSYAYDTYVIFFQYLEDTLEIIMITEGHRDIEILFDD